MEVEEKPLFGPGVAHLDAPLVDIRGVPFLVSLLTAVFAPGGEDRSRVVLIVGNRKRDIVSLVNTIGKQFPKSMNIGSVEDEVSEDSRSWTHFMGPMFMARAEKEVLTVTFMEGLEPEVLERWIRAIRVAIKNKKKICIGLVGREKGTISFEHLEAFVDLADGVFLYVGKQMDLGVEERPLVEGRYIKYVREHLLDEAKKLDI